MNKGPSEIVLVTMEVDKYNRWFTKILRGQCFLDSIDSIFSVSWRGVRGGRETKKSLLSFEFCISLKLTEQIDI